MLLAPVPCVHLESAASIPSLSKRVAFGTSRHGLNDIPIGLPIFIYASQPPHRLFHREVASWTGVLGAIVKADESGRRSGKHPDPSVRPPSAESDDGPFLYFWEVLGLHQLEPHQPLSMFTKESGGTFKGEVPEWPVLCSLDG